MEKINSTADLIKAVEKLYEQVQQLRDEIEVLKGGE